jgi:DNA-directed RNA polymerase subunit RPC12/RpoP
MNKYKYILDPGSKKYKCPKCGKITLVIFLDSETGERMETYGRCDREAKCGFKNLMNSEISNDAFIEIFPSFHKNNLVELTMSGDNNLLKYLRFLFGRTIANSVQKNINRKTKSTIYFSKKYKKLL